MLCDIRGKTVKGQFIYPTNWKDIRFHSHYHMDHTLRLVDPQTPRCKSLNIMLEWENKMMQSEVEKYQARVTGITHQRPYQGHNNCRDRVRQAPVYMTNTGPNQNQTHRYFHNWRNQDPKRDVCRQEKLWQPPHNHNVGYQYKHGTPGILYTVAKVVTQGCPGQEYGEKHQMRS